MQLPRLRQVRERKLMTIRELAAAAGISTNTVVRLERGLPAEFRTVRKLAEALRVEPQDLMAPEQDQGHEEAA